jgi:AP-2 complex subunit alpha
MFLLSFRRNFFFVFLRCLSDRPLFKLALKFNTLLNLRFVFKSSDVLFENNMLQISVKGEYRKNIGRLAMVYSNKTSYTFQNFQTSTEQQIGSNELKISILPCENLIAPHGQIQQIINAECLQEFVNIPSLTVQFKFVF